MSLLVSNAASQCTFDDRLLESSVSRNALEQNWVKFVRHNGKTIVPFYFTRETTLSTQREMRKIFLQIEKEMGDGCPIRFVQTKDANDKRANIHIKQDSKKCGNGSIGGVVHRKTENFLELVMTVSACPSNLKLWRQYVCVSLLVLVLKLPDDNVPPPKRQRCIANQYVGRTATTTLK